MSGDGDDRDAVRDAFSLLSHDVRLDIVLALLADWEAVYTEPVTYSELMDAVGVADSGKFNYHLDRLRGVYVEQVEDGYVPTASATALYRTVLAHRPAATGGDRTLAFDAACPACDAALVGRYERAFLTVTCPDCDRPPLVTYPFPENGVRSRPEGDVLPALQDRATFEIGLAATGQCPDCAGETAVDVDDASLDERSVPRAAITCRNCSYTVDVNIMTPLQFVPDVAAALVDVGVHTTPGDVAGDLAGGQLHGGPALSGRVVAEDPFRAEIDVEGEEGRARIVVDGDLDVQRVTVD